MARRRTHSIEFKRQVALEYLAGDTLKGLARQHDLSRNLIRLWVKKFEAGEFDEDAVAIDLAPPYEARIAALERLVGKQALEIEFLKGAHKLADRRRGAPRPRSPARRPRRRRRMQADGARALDLLRRAQGGGRRHGDRRGDGGDLR